MNTITIPLDAAGIEDALPLVGAGLAKYCRLRDALHGVDVSLDREFQRLFNGFYRVRRNAQWQRTFYTLLEDQKTRRASFLEVLRGLHAGTGRVEASFASKLVATVDPDQPVIDAIVLRNLGLRLKTTGTADGRLAGAATVHETIAASYAAFLDGSAGRELQERFRSTYPALHVTPVKMLDLVLWQSRSRQGRHGVGDHRRQGRPEGTT